MKLRWIQTRKTAQRNLKDRTNVTGSDERCDYAGPESYAENTVQSASKRAVNQGRGLLMEQSGKRRQEKYKVTKENLVHANEAGIYSDKAGADLTSPPYQRERQLKAKKSFFRRRAMRNQYVQKLRREGGFQEGTTYGPFGTPESRAPAFLKTPSTSASKRDHLKVKVPPAAYGWILSASGLFAMVLIVIIMLASVMALHGDEEGGNIPENETIVEVAESQIGNQGGRPYWSWYGFTEHVDWCACFVSWCADQCGYIDEGKAPKFSYCQDGVSWFISKKSWYRSSISPRPGMIIFFDWDGNGTSDHVGIVKDCRDGIVYTIEGNSGDQCREMWYTVGSSAIYGYGGI